MQPRSIFLPRKMWSLKRTSGRPDATPSSTAAPECVVIVDPETGLPIPGENGAAFDYAAHHHAVCQSQVQAKIHQSSAGLHTPVAPHTNIHLTSPCGYNGKPEPCTPLMQPAYLPASAGYATTLGSWSCLKSFLQTLERYADALSPLKASFGEIVGCIDIFERLANNREEFRALKVQLEQLFKELQQHLSYTPSPTITSSMECLSGSIMKELMYLKERQNRGTVGLDESGDEVFACYRRIQDHLQRLSLNANLSTWKIVDEQATNACLDRLDPSFSARYNSSQAADLRRGVCTPGTRIDILAQMHSWVYGAAPGSVYWVNGMAGTGKTTIAYSLCHELDQHHNLGASFFCSRLLPECRDVNRIVPSIAYQLAEFSRPFRYALARVLGKERNVHTQLLHMQFEMLVVKPLTYVRDTLPKDLVVVIDALDECDSKKSTSRILEALLTKTQDLPIKFLIASRPEPEIRDQIKKQNNGHAVERLVLHEFDKDKVQEDIEKYIRDALQGINPSDEDIEALTHRAGILFIYASTVVRYIGHDNFSQNPRKRLQNVLNLSSAAGSNPYKDIDELYTLILDAALKDPDLDNEEREDRKQVLFAVLCAQEPTHINTLSGLLGLHDVERIYAALRPLWSVLHIVESSYLVTTLHASFPDYMADPKRSGGNSCNLTTQHYTLAQHCFDRIKGTLPQFNICGLESSFVPDDMIPNLNARANEAISPELCYACRYWAAHLQRAEPLPELVQWLEDFMSKHLLLWMEIMNLKNCMSTGLGIILQAEEWCVRQSCPEDLVELIEDAWRFAAEFLSNPVSKSTAHIYVSMLSLWPPYSPIGKYYAARRVTQGMIAQGAAVTMRQFSLLATWKAIGEVESVVWSPNSARIALNIRGEIHIWDSQTGRPLPNPLGQAGFAVKSIAFSPDGTRIVSGSDDKLVRVWNAKTGQLMLEPLAGHTDWVVATVFSMDGTKIVSGSGDKTIRMWKVRNGQSVLEPFRGHTGCVRSVAFSPGGTRMVSGSTDTTIRVWDPHSGRAVMDPLRGHTSWIRSVAFSPDAALIASGSDDKTIRIWDAHTGQALLEPLKGHTDWVTSVSFSPTGSRIASGSSDGTVRMWNAQNGRAIHSPLEGHTDWVTSVAFSPDGTRIASSSGDGFVRMWNARSLPTVRHSPGGHNNSITSVAFSPDGTRVVSGSKDRSIRVWDSQSGVKLLSTSHKHNRSVRSVAFSPDGTRIASGSIDGTVRMWDALIGQHVGPPLKHNSEVTSLAFSPNGTLLVSGSTDGALRVWIALSGELMLPPLQGHTERLTSVAFSPKSDRIVSGSEDKTLCIWDAYGGELLHGPLTGHDDSVTSVAFLPDGVRVVSGSYDGTLRMWDSQTGEELALLFQFPENTTSAPIRSISLSPDGACVAAGSDDMCIRVWSTRTGKLVLGPLRGHTDSVKAVAFSPDGNRIISGSADNTLRMWDAQSRRKSDQPGFPRIAPFSWTITPDGWVVDSSTESIKVVWVPSDLRHALELPSPKNMLWRSGDVSLNLFLCNAKIGETWASSSVNSI